MFLLVSSAAARYRVKRTGLKQLSSGTPMLVLIFSPVFFPQLIFKWTSLVNMYSMCSSSSGRISCISSNNDFLYTVSNALLISSISRCVS